MFLFSCRGREVQSTSWPSCGQGASTVLTLTTTQSEGEEDIFDVTLPNCASSN